ADHTGPSEAVDDPGRDKIIEEDNIVNNVVDKENENPNVMDSDSSDSEVEMDQIPYYSMLYSYNESEYSDRCEDELTEFRKRISKAKRAPKAYKQKPCSNKEGGEGSSRPKTLYGLGKTEIILEHEEFMDDLVRRMRDCDDDAKLTYPFKLVETRVEKYPTHDQDTH
nr:pentatricopeptide repeat-containing protein [Tanacetum cinerariifolium]GFA71187.1 pentatricopeptide repeat-containing protein [Tanacetum cinerariifolium]